MSLGTILLIILILILIVHSRLGPTAPVGPTIPPAGSHRGHHPADPRIAGKVLARQAHR